MTTGRGGKTSSKTSAAPPPSLYRGCFRYEGQLDGLRRPHGAGKLYAGDTLLYHGEFVEGEMHGVGVRFFQSGATYHGEVHHGMCSGKGTKITTAAWDAAEDTSVAKAQGDVAKEASLPRMTTYDMETSERKRATVTEEGSFIDGLLHGTDCRVTIVNGEGMRHRETLCGSFRKGRRHGILHDSRGNASVWANGKRVDVQRAGNGKEEASALVRSSESSSGSTVKRRVPKGDRGNGSFSMGTVKMASSSHSTHAHTTSPQTLPDTEMDEERESSNDHSGDGHHGDDDGGYDFGDDDIIELKA